jgi:hypothetical protein
MSFEYLIDPEKGLAADGAARGPRDHRAAVVPPFPRMQAAAQRHHMDFLPDLDRSDADS